MTANHPVKPTITPRLGILEQIGVVPWGVALMLFLIALIIPFPNQVSSAADVIDQARNICVGDPQSDKGILLTDPNSQGPPISLGCKLRNCGPPSPIVMRIRLDGASVVDSLRIKFTNLPAAKEDLIKEITGTALTGIRDGSVRIPRGKQVVLQISPDLIKDGISVNTNVGIKVTLVPDKFFLKKVRRAPESDRFHENNWTAKLAIDQLKGSVVVNEFKALYRIKWCLSPQLQFDLIKFSAADSGPQRIVLVNGRSPFGCLRYKPFMGTHTVHIDNLLSTSTECSNEIVVFSPDRAIYIGKFHQDWTDASGEVREVQLPRKLLQVKVNFWILQKLIDPDGTVTDIEETKERIKTHLKVANELFGPTNMCGIEFVASEESFHDVSVESAAEGLSRVNCDSDFDLRQKLAEKDWEIPESLNVYYSYTPGAHGMTCGVKKIYIGERPTDETLAHEFGHVLGLQHYTERDSGNEALIKKNLMDSASGPIMRTSLTLGQCFRCAVNPDNILKETGNDDLREKRTCSSTTTDERTAGNTAQCVDMALHVPVSGD